MAHTKGPWRVYEHDKRVVVGLDGHVVADVRTWRDADDAVLIAAAPEILSALEMLLLDFQDIAGSNGYATDWIAERTKDAEAAIAKARSDTPTPPAK